MPRTEIDLDPVIRLTTDAIGQPGQRVFYIQGRDEHTLVTLLVEKAQIQSLALGVGEFMQQLIERFPDLEPASNAYDEAEMRVETPLEPLFHIGEIGLAYDSDRDLACLIATEIIAEGMQEEDAGVVRFWCTRSQLVAMSAWGQEVASRGRPLCPQCGEPMDPGGHFCPKKNGHKH